MIAAITSVLALLAAHAAAHSCKVDQGYNQIYSGNGYTANPTDINRASPPLSTDLYSTIAENQHCQAVDVCASLASNADYSGFDVHFLTTEQNWQCVIYNVDDFDASAFSTANADVGAVYGYST